MEEQAAVRHEVGVAADGRREVQVRRAGEAEVPEVARRVARLLERAQDQRRPGEAAAVLADARLEDEAAEAAVELGQLGRRHRLAGRERRRGHPELLELVEELARARRLGRLVHAVERVRLLAQQVLGHGLVGGEHELLDQRVRGRLRARCGAAQRARVVERVLGLERADGEGAAGRGAGGAAPRRARRPAAAARAARRPPSWSRRARRAAAPAARPPGARRAAPRRPALGSASGIAAASAPAASSAPRRVHGRRADDRVGEAVGQAVVAADQRAVVLRGGAPPCGVEGELDGEALARLPRHQAAEVAAQRRRQHGLGEQRQVQAGGAPASLALDLAVVVDEVRDVGDVHVRAVAGALARDRDGVVEVARGVRVDGEGRQRR